MQVLGVTESAVQCLRERIITGDLKPGQRLNEQDLAEDLGISRPPLREALRILENDCLVVSIPRRGASVTKLSASELQELYSARHMVETYAFDIIERKNIREFGVLKESLEYTGMLPLPTPSDSTGWFAFWKAFSDFHHRLVKVAQNDYLIKFYDVIAYNLARYQVIYLRLPGSKSESYGDHERIVKMLEAGAYAQAKELLGHHLVQTHRRLEESIKQQGDMNGETIVG